MFYLYKKKNINVLGVHAITITWKDVPSLLLNEKKVIEQYV